MLLALAQYLDRSIQIEEVIFPRSSKSSKKTFPVTPADEKHTLTCSPEICEFAFDCTTEKALALDLEVRPRLYRYKKALGEKDPGSDVRPADNNAFSTMSGPNRVTQCGGVG